jgi:hypothetical protein
MLWEAETQGRAASICAPAVAQGAIVRPSRYSQNTINSSQKKEGSCCKNEARSKTAEDLADQEVQSVNSKS